MGRSVAAIALSALAAGALSSCAHGAARAPALIVELDGVDPPPLPARCGEATLPPSDGWVVFATEGCRHCHDVLADLEGLRAAGRVPAATVVAVGVASCGAARQVAVSEVGPITRISATEAARWGVEAYPTLYLLSGGRVVRKVAGRPGVGVLSTLRGPPPADENDFH